MPLIAKSDEYEGFAPGTLSFWRNLVIFFCVFSVVGHWLEIAYCSFMDIFGIVDEDSLVWDDPFYPFIVYGVGTVVCTLVLVPLKIMLLERCRKMWTACIAFYVITVGVCMVMELGMGLMLNQPDAFGNYPLWDNSELPLNILGQAWLVNDIVLGIVAMLYTWVLYPLCDRAMRSLPSSAATVLFVFVTVGFIVLCIVKF